MKRVRKLSPGDHESRKVTALDRGIKILIFRRYFDQTDTIPTGSMRSSKCRQRLSIPLVNFIAIFFLIFGAMRAEAQWPHTVLSKDGTPISYEVHGTGEPTLVFVHGWCCDARYWRAQVPYFSKHHRVVILDLAGHGHSGMARSNYSMSSFGEDVRAVTEAIGADGVILLGHSMGGSVIAEAARIMPGRVIGLIGVDTLENIEYPMTPGEMTKMLAPLKDNFRIGVQQFVKQMISPRMDTQLRTWILSDMSAAPPTVALSALRCMMSQYITGEAARIFDEIRMPVISVNSDIWPVDYEANRRHMAFFDAIILKGADHFLMMDHPEEFNGAVDRAITMILEKRKK